MLDTLATKIAEKLIPVVINKLAPIIVGQITTLLPVIAAATAKAIGDQLRAEFPDIHVPAVHDLAEDIRQQLNLIQNVDIKPLSDIFDFAEWLKQR
jgi:hypothetical protein